MRDRLLPALRGVAGVRFCETASELLELAAQPRVSVVITELRDRRHVSTLPVIAVLHCRFPSILTFVRGRLIAGDIHEIMATVRDGWAEAIIDGVDDPGTRIRSAISQMREQSSSALITESVKRFVPPSLAAFFRFAAIHSTRRLSVRDVALAFDVDRKTLRNRLANAGLPTPQRILGWNRLLHASRLLNDPGRSIASAAVELEFASASGLINMHGDTLHLRRPSCSSAAVSTACSARICAPWVARPDPISAVSRVWADLRACRSARGRLRPQLRVRTPPARMTPSAPTFAASFRIDSNICARSPTCRRPWSR